MPKITVVAAVFDTASLVLYRQDGEKITIEQGHPALPAVLEAITKPLSTEGSVEIDLEALYELHDPDTERNTFSQFEKSTGGSVSIFRVAKRWIKNLFGRTDTQETVQDPICGTQIYGKIPDEPETTNNPGLVAGNQGGEQETTKLDSAIADIMKNAEPVSSPTYRDRRTTDEHTFVAQVTDTETGRTSLVPGVENLKGQFEHANKLGSPQGVTNFLRRIGAVIGNRGHTIDELLRFMSRGDLPIADDGSIIGYKVLKTVPGTEKRYYVDCYTGKVRQRVGSLVVQKNVDPNRRTECSTGLHIARRGYLRYFPGNVITLVRINPEDVIAVPLNEPDKMRAGGYHIIAELPFEDHNALRSNQPLKTEVGKKLLASAIRGEHVPIIETVVIGGPAGTDVEVILEEIAKNGPLQLLVEDQLPAETETGAQPVEPIDIDKPDEPVKKIEAIDPRNVGKTVVETKNNRKSLIESHLETMRRSTSLDAKVAAAKAIQDIKQKSRRAYCDLGLSQADETLVREFVGKSEKTAPKISPKTVSKTVPAATSETGQNNPRTLYEAGNWSELYAYKKSRKVSWYRLGFRSSEEEKILQNKPKSD